jgi:hypothetical protein
MRTFLTQTETVPETATAKYKLRASARNSKTRAPQNVPAERATDYQFEFPAIYRLAPIANDRNQLSTSAWIIFRDREISNSFTDICPWIAA